MMSKTLRTAWFLLFLSFFSVAGYAGSSPALLHGQKSSYVRHSSGEGDIAENPDEHVRESTEQFFRRTHS